MQRIHVARLAWSALVMAVCLIGYCAVALGPDLARNFNRLRTADWENPQWTVSHTEVEFLRLRAELAAAPLEPIGATERVRLRFDIFYSRLEGLDRSSLAILLREQTDYRTQLAVIQRYLQLAAAIVDAPDFGSLEDFARLAEMSRETYPALRELSMITLENWTQATSERRAELTQILNQLTTALVVGIVLLAGSIGILIQLHLVLERRQFELEAARDRAVAGEQSKARFLAIMSHEIRNPLAGLMGSLSLLEGSRLRSDQADLVGTMQSSGSRLMELLNRVLDISREEAGLTTIQPRPVNVAELVRSVTHSLRDSALRKAVRVTCSVDAITLRLLMADGVLLAKVLENLIGNAIKFTDAGQVSVLASSRLAEDGRHKVTFQVKDSGCGIAKADQARIFDDFETGPSAMPEVGAGLGLGITRRIVDAMGGQIELESSVGEGSKFTVSLSLEEAVPVAVTQPSNPPETGAASSGSMRGLRVLVAEDVPANLMVMELMLKGDGHTVLTASDGGEALEMCRTQSFDIVLLDIAMPLMCGIDVLKTVRAERLQPATTVFCAATAFAMPSEAERLSAAGFDHVLFKPVERHVLRRVMGEVVPLTGADVA